MHTWWQYATVTALSALKFMVGVASGLALQLPFWEQFTCTALGGIIGVVAYAFVGEGIAQVWHWLYARLLKRRAPTQNKTPAPAAAWVQRIWQRFGLWGLALIAPPTLGPPIAVPLAVLLSTGTNRTATRWRVAVVMSLSVLAWAAVLAWSGREMMAWLQKLPG